MKKLIPLILALVMLLATTVTVYGCCGGRTRGTATRGYYAGMRCRYADRCTYNPNYNGEEDSAITPCPEDCYYYRTTIIE